MFAYSPRWYTPYLPAPLVRSRTKASAIAALVAILIAVLSLAGCGLTAQPTPLTPQDQAIQHVTEAEAAYLLVTTPIDIAIANGDIKGQTAAAIQAAEDLAMKYLAAARTAAKAGTPIDAETQLQLFEEARADLIKAFTKSKPPATAPAPSTAPAPTAARMPLRLTAVES